MIKLGNWVGERTETVGAGAIVMVGRLDGFASFSIIGDGEVYYTIQDGISKETGIGTITGNVMERNKVSATIDSVGNYSTDNTPIYLSGNAHVFCTANADFMEYLYNGIDSVDASALRALQSAEAAAISEQVAVQSALDAGSSKVAAANSESKVAEFASNAAASATSALASKNSAAMSEANALNSATASSASAASALNSSTSAQSYATSASSSATAAAASKDASLANATAAKTSADNAAISASSANKSKQDAATSAADAISAKDTAVRSAENIESVASYVQGAADDAYSYQEQAKQYSESASASADSASAVVNDAVSNFASYVTFINCIADWMTANNKVSIELPNGDIISVDQLKAFATEEWVSKAILGIGQASGVEHIFQSPDGEMIWSAGNDALLAGASRGQISLELTKTGKTKIRYSIDLLASNEYASFKMWRRNGEFEDGGVLFQTAPYVQSSDGSTMITLVDQSGKIGSATVNRNSWNFPRDGINRTVTSREWVMGTAGVGIGSGDAICRMIDFANHTQASGLYTYDSNTLNTPTWLTKFGGAIRTRYSNNTEHHLMVPNYGDIYLAVHRNAGGVINAVYAITSNQVVVDANGFYKKSSPIIQIMSNGSFNTNEESEGATVELLSTGKYVINGVLGYNSDGAWGVEGGISIPKDNNGLELIFVSDKINEDGNISLEIFHRQHAHLPEKFQNWRTKEISASGEKIYYADGEPCDLPESTRIDVRVEMPQDSIWNMKQVVDDMPAP